MRLRGQVFTIDFLAAVLILTVLLGIFIHSIEFSLKEEPQSTLSAALLSQGLLNQRAEIVLNNTLFTQCAPGYCYALEPHVADTLEQTGPLSHGTSSLSILLEDNKVLGPAHTSEIKEGSYSDRWDSARGYYLTMSASDNNDPRTNNAVYRLLYFKKPLFNVKQAFCVTQSVEGKEITNSCKPYDFSRCDIESTTRLAACGAKTCVMRVHICHGEAVFKAIT